MGETETAYKALMQQNNPDQTQDTQDEGENRTVTGKIRKIAQTVINGNSHYYIVLEGSDSIYDVNVSANVNIILLEEGDMVTLTYKESGETYPVIKVEDGSGTEIDNPA